jgi:hypothetical protein
VFTAKTFLAERNPGATNLKDGQTAQNYDTQEQKGRPRTSPTDENCVIVEGLAREDRRVKVRGIAEVIGIAKYTVHEII